MAFTREGIKRAQEKELKARREEKANALLLQHNKQKTPINRKKTADEIKELINPKLYQSEWFIRDPKEWKATSYNTDRQIIDFCKWVYCEYEVPSFFFSLFTSYEKDRHMIFFVPGRKETEYEFFFDWFLTITNGYPFAKATNNFFTKREAHIFLNLKTSGTIKENFWLAKCVANNLSTKLTNFVINRFSNMSYLWDSFWYEAVKFINRFEDEIEIQNLNDICDYLNSIHQRDKKFSLKDRTYSSLIKLSNEWHEEGHLKNFGNSNVCWVGLPIPDWEYIQPKTETVWKIKQLLTSKELYQEGKIMHHCVATYVSQCHTGNSSIFSLRKNEFINSEEHVATIEVYRPKQISQIRKKRNAPVDNEVAKVINRWAIDNKLQQR